MKSRLSDIDFIIRPALTSDIDAIASLDRNMWGEWANPATLYRQLVDLFPETVIVGYAPGDKYAGCAVGLVRPDRCAGLVLSVDIAEEFRGKGLGRRLVEEVLKAFRRLEVEQAVAMIDPSNTASKRLFGSFGFARESVEKDYFGPGKDQERWVLRTS